MKNKRAIVAITGASGVEIGVRLLRILALADADVYCIATDAATAILRDEMSPATDVSKALELVCESGEFEKISKKISLCKIDDFYQPPASGSFYFDAMAIAPCSMKSLGKLANGIADNLALRAAEVALKERRRLVVCPRETPLALTHLKNMCAIAEAGAVVQPPMVSFYNKPKTASDIAEFTAARIAQSMGFQQNVFKEWGL